MFAKWVHKRDAPAERAYDGTATVDDDNGYAIYLAVQCTDAQWPQPCRRVLADNARVYRTAPFETWGNAWFNAPCLYWKVARARRCRSRPRRAADPADQRDAGRGHPVRGRA